MSLSSVRYMYCLLLAFTVLCSAQVSAEARLPVSNPSPVPPSGDLQCGVNGNTDFIVEFDVIGSDSYQEVVFTRNNGSSSDSDAVRLWYTQQVQSGSDYVFNEQRLDVDQRYKLRIEIERETGQDLSRAHYYWVINGDKRFQESKDVKLHNGTVDGIGVGLTTFHCEEGNVEPPVVEPELPDICPYFPDHLAGNNYSNGKPIHNNLTISNGTGNPGNQIFMPTTEPVSFNTTSVSGVGGCVYDGVTSSNCEIDANKVLFNGSPLVPDSFVVEGESIHVPDASSKKLVPGSYGTITFGMNGSKLILEQGEYWINEFKIANNEASIEVEGPVVIHYNSFNVAASRVSINSGSGTHQDNLVLIGHGKDSHFWLNGFFEWVEIKAHWYVSPLAAAVGFDINAANRFSYTGSIVTPRLFLRGGDTNKINAIAPEKCDAPISSDYRVELTPLSDIALTCETIDVQVQVTQKDGTLATNFTGTVTVEQTNGSTQILTPESGVLDQSIAFSSDTVMTKKVTAYITDNRTQTEVEAQYKFVPYRLALSPNPLSVIAGKAEDITVRPLECSDSGRPISSVDFEGVRELTLSNTVYDKPTDPTYSAPIELRARDREGDWVSAPDDLILEFNKVDGEIVAVTQLRYAEAGEVSLALVDQECFEDAEGNLKCKKYSGSQTVLARPWTFAICEGNTALKDGTADGGDAFVAAGERFDLNVRPIRWQDDSEAINEFGEVGASGYCDDEFETVNFYHDDAPNAVVQLSSALHTPSDGDSSKQLSSDNGLEREHNTSPPISFDELYWAEVGSLRVKANTKGAYLGMTIDTGYRDIGRFYPKFFKVVDSDWTYPNGQSFVYMNQPLEQVVFQVEALNADQQPVSHYAVEGYSSGLQASFELYEQNAALTGRFASVKPNATWAIDGNRSIGRFQVKSSSLISCGTTELCWYKAPTAEGYEDGPFNQGGDETSISITHQWSNNVDPIEYPPHQQASAVDPTLLNRQPVIRFGRAVLSNASGRSIDSLFVPLSIEYWNGSRFVSHADDSQTHFHGISVVGDNHQIWVEEGKTADSVNLQGEGTAKTGATYQISTVKAGDVRQQTQLWLELNKGENRLPWLAYRWQDPNRGSDFNNEQDPSAIMTFGIYRGNDKIIFRGERGLTGR